MIAIIFGTRYLIVMLLMTMTLFLDDVPESPEGVVGVHNRVDHEVHDDEPPCWRGVLAE